MKKGMARVGDIVRVMDEKWWESSVGEKWIYEDFVIDGVKVCNVHRNMLGKLMIVTQVTADGCYLIGENLEAAILFPWEMLDDGLGNVTRKDMEMLKKAYNNEFREKLRRSIELSEKNFLGRVKTQWIAVKDDDMPENISMLKKSQDEHGTTMTEEVMVLLRNGSMAVGRRYRLNADTEWQWLPKMRSKPLYWLLMPERPKFQGPFGGEIGDGWTWRTRVKAWLLRLIG